MRRVQGYSALQIVLHWTIAALIVFQLLVNEGMQDAFDDRIDGDRIEDMGAAVIHVVAGLAVLALAMVRVVVRLVRGVPEPPKDNPAIITWVGWVTHLALYGFIFAMPITGAIAWFGGVEFSATLHELGRLVLIPLIGVHALGGLAEHFVFRNDTLVRMLVPNHRNRRQRDPAVEASDSNG